jgi:acyl-CoA carboxylase subunit beta
VAPVTRARDVPWLGPEDLTPLATSLPGDDPLGFPGYRDRLRDARARSDADESLTVGVGVLDGVEVVAAIGAFDFLGGSMGRAHGQRVVEAMAVAAERRLPFVALTSSGGARMQEGMLSLVQMSRAAEGMRLLREQGVPSLVLLRHPTTGGVLASYGSLADVRLAEAGATIGFAGPRVVETVTGEPVGADSHTSESALATGQLDAVGDAPGIVAALGRWARLLHPARRTGPLPAATHVEEPVVEHDAWDAVQRARRPDRPSARDVLADVFDAHEELRGDRVGEDDPAALAAVARLGERTVVVVGHDRRGRAAGHDRRPGAPVAAGYRKLARALQLARRHGLAVVSLIDTPGADPSPASERSGVAGAIAETFVATLDVTAPTIGVVVGEGGSGGALAIGCTDRLLMQDDAVFEVIAPEGAAAILHRDPTRAEEVAGHLRPTASQLRRQGVADRVLPGPTTLDPGTASTALHAELAATLAELDSMPDRLAVRARRYGVQGHASRGDAGAPG